MLWVFGLIFCSGWISFGLALLSFVLCWRANFRGVFLERDDRELHVCVVIFHTPTTRMEIRTRRSAIPDLN